MGSLTARHEIAGRGKAAPGLASLLAHRAGREDGRPSRMGPLTERSEITVPKAQGARSLVLGCLLAALALLPRSGTCGEVGDTMGAYGSAGAGVGALLGSAAAAIPYFQTKQPMDFLTGAGVGMLAGCGLGLVLGIVDLSNQNDDAFGGPRPGLSLAWTPQAMAASWTVKF
jgi:hypothetical protein